LPPTMWIVAPESPTAQPATTATASSSLDAIAAAARGPSLELGGCQLGRVARRSKKAARKSRAGAQSYRSSSGINCSALEGCS
jgi:hypothetical protein